MSHSQFHCIKSFILRHAWLNLWDKHMTTGRINQVTIFSTRRPHGQPSLQIVFIEFFSLETDNIQTLPIKREEGKSVPRLNAGSTQLKRLSLALWGLVKQGYPRRVAPSPLRFAKWSNSSFRKTTESRVTLITSTLSIQRLIQKLSLLNTFRLRSIA